MQTSLSERDRNALGTPGDTVTHWGISRVGKENGKEKLERLSFAEGDGVYVREFPIDILTVDEVRARWGAGTYKCHWLCNDDTIEDSTKRRQSGGHGKVFTLDAELPTRIAAPHREPAPQIATSPNGLSADSLMNVVTTMMQLADKRADSMIQAVTQLAGRQQAAPVVSQDSALAAEVAALRAKIEADEKRREIEQKHRDELAARDREVAELKRKLEDVEREGERESAPKIEPGSPVLSQIGYGIANAAMAKPELVGALLEKVGPIAAALFGGGNAAPSPGAGAPPASGPPPNGVPAPKAVAQRVVPPVVVTAPRPKPDDGPPPVSSWVPMAGSAGANGAPPPAEDKPVEAKPAEAVAG